jgi:hypothetical protein
LAPSTRCFPQVETCGYSREAPSGPDDRREYPELEDEDIRQALAFAATYLDDKILPPVIAR